ncbi:MAG: Uma2 family endonuclease [Chloroflexaceae bacterium]|jgi:Uma2 family endonuclease|nr:Uma2 family endonuclease [Chloroflexaceae bacterium]
MTTTAPLDPTTQAEQPDPWRYGWRYVHHQLPDGSSEVEQVPLTLDDVLHPEEGDQVTHTVEHVQFCTYLTNVFEAQLRNSPTAVVLSDVRVAWDVPGLRPHGPDIAVIFGVREKRNWSTFDVAEEGVRPSLIIEVTSPETRKIDLYDKLEQYEQADVPMYVIVETYTHKGVAARRLRGHQMTPTGYAPMQPDERGWLWLEPVSLWLGLQDGIVECYDEAGQPLGDYTAMAETLARLSAERAEAERQAQAEAAARSEAEQRLFEAEQRRAQAERQAQAEAAARAQAERQAQVEAAARATVEERLRTLEMELERLRKGE